MTEPQTQVPILPAPRLRLEFAFPKESNDHNAPVELPIEWVSIVPNIGDMVTVRKGFLRKVLSRHFCYEQNLITVTVVCD